MLQNFILDLVAQFPDMNKRVENSYIFNYSLDYEKTEMNSYFFGGRIFFLNKSGEDRRNLVKGEKSSLKIELKNGSTLKKRLW